MRKLIEFSLLGLFFLILFLSGYSLSDNSERVKYKADPPTADSDGNRTADNNCNESRKNAYKVHVVMKIRQPFEAMNDDYQDVRVVDRPKKGEEADGYWKIDASIYPETQVRFTESAYPLKDLPKELQADTKAGFSTNYDDGMQAEVLKIVAKARATTDVQAVKSILKWVNDKTRSCPPPDIAEVYYTYLGHGKVEARNYYFEIPVDTLLRTQYFAASMFWNRIHGSCSSIATLKCAMIKSAGIPCRLIWTIFPIYYHEYQKEPYEKKLSRAWDCPDCSYELKSTDFSKRANHAFLEVYLGKQWVRVDEDTHIYNQTRGCLCLKILSVADWSEVDFSKHWPVDWVSERPYYTQLIEDQEPQR